MERGLLGGEVGIKNEQAVIIFHITFISFTMDKSKQTPFKTGTKNLDSFEVRIAPKYLLSKKIIKEGVQRSPPAGAQGKGIQHQQDGKKFQGHW